MEYDKNDENLTLKDKIMIVGIPIGLITLTAFLPDPKKLAIPVVILAIASFIIVCVAGILYIEPKYHKKKEEYFDEIICVLRREAKSSKTYQDYIIKINKLIKENNKNGNIFLKYDNKEYIKNKILENMLIYFKIPKDEEKNHKKQFLWINPKL